MNRKTNIENPKTASPKPGQRIYRRRLLAAAGAVFAAVLLLVALVAGMISNNRKTIIETQSGQLSAISKSVAVHMEALVDTLEDTLEMEAGITQFEQAEEAAAKGDPAPMEDMLRQFLDGQDNLVTEMSYESAGVLLRARQDGKEARPLITAKAMTEEDAGMKITIEQDEEENCYLKLSQRTQKGARLSAVLSFSGLYDKTASYIKMGENGYVMVKSSDGLIVMHQVDAQIGQDVLSDRQEMYPDFDFSELETLIAHQEEGRSGVEIYHSYWWAEDPPRPVRKVSAYDPVFIGDDFLIVSAVIDYAEITVPLQEATVRIVAAAALLVLFLAAFFWLIWLLARRQRQVEMENLRLKEINEGLEELRKQEEAMAHRQRLQLIGTMTGGIAHEFNNLLTPIMGYSAMMLEEMEEHDKYYEDVREILNSAERAKEIIGQISAFGRKNSQKEFCDLLIGQTAAKAMLVAESGKPKQVEISMDLVFEPYYLYGNETEIHQIVLNLCTNAFHAMESGGTLTVSGRVKAGREVSGETEEMKRFFAGREEEKFYELTFSDTGCGMTEEIKSQIFDPFFTTRRTGEGTGLGLFMVHRMVEAYRGGIFAESAPGMGTTFRIFFPVHKNEG